MLTPVIENIIVNYLNKEASASELDTLELWLEEGEANLEIFRSYVKTNHLIDATRVTFDTKNSKKKLLTLISKEKKVIKMRTYSRVASYAAVLVVLIAVGFLIKDNFLSKGNQESGNQSKIVENTIKIGTDKATLTLEDGSEVVLNKGTSYQTAYAESDGEALVYQNESGAPIEIVYNVLTIPRGGQFFVQLSDGTKVWLNSESQLKYPKNFIAGKPRNVELVYGEAYFEVSPNTGNNGILFNVVSKNQNIEVLGTQFNVKAYQDEQAIYTTLVEGKIALEANGQKKILKPNQQAIVSNNAGLITVKTVEVYNEVSWKDGVFSFKGKPLKELMTVLSRWYDVDVVFENNALETITFKGVLGKEQSIEDILFAIKAASLINSYDITNKTITIK